MDCAEARKLLPALALGELDAEPSRALQSHLEGCSGCRAEQASLAAAAEALRAPAPLAGSTERREAAAAAMARAHAEEVERRLFLRRRRPWLAWAAAAALVGIAAAGAVFGMRGFAIPQFVFRAEEVRGRADVFRAEEGRWVPLAAGGMILPGDRMVTQPDARVRMEILDRPSVGPSGQLVVDGDASLARVDRRRIALDRGRLFLELRANSGDSLVITDTANNRVALLKGRLEVGLREVRAVVAGAKESSGGRGEGPVPEARADVARRLIARVAEGEAMLRGSQDQTLFAGPGQEGDFDLGGKPRTKDAAPPAGPAWWESR